MKFLRNALVALLLVLAAAELAAWAFCSLYAERFQRADLAMLVPSQERIDLERHVFHPQLGWKRRFPTAHGQRPQVQRHGQALVATYGDSFTYCDEVLGFETWQTHLSGLLGADVLNFGNGGYGPDQAYLRFLEDQPAVGAKYAVLSLIGENIGRVVNVYRRFYLPEEGNALTKPRFHLINGQLTLDPNPTPTPQSRQQLRDPAFLQAIGRNDYWYQRRQGSAAGFPYSSIFLRINRLQELINNLQWMRLWDEDEPRQLMLAILDAFARDARAMGATPVVAILPMQYDLLRMAEGGAAPAYVHIVAEHCRQAGIACFDAVSAMAAGSKAVGELFLATHYSPLGNERLALAWHDYFRTAFPEDFGALPPAQALLASPEAARLHAAVLPRTRGVMPLRQLDGVATVAASATSSQAADLSSDVAATSNASALAAWMLTLDEGEGEQLPGELLDFAVHFLTQARNSAADLAESLLLSDTLQQRPGLTDQRFVELAAKALWGAPPSAEELARLTAQLTAQVADNATRADVFYQLLWDARFRDRCAAFGVRAY